jgi:hypothetical protein
MSVRQKGPGSQHYRYDADNRLVGAKGDGPKRLFEAQYHYDALGRQSSKVSPSVRNGVRPISCGKDCGCGKVVLMIASKPTAMTRMKLIHRWSH